VSVGIARAWVTRAVVISVAIFDQLPEASMMQNTLYPATKTLSGSGPGGGKHAWPISIARSRHSSLRRAGVDRDRMTESGERLLPILGDGDIDKWALDVRRAAPVAVGGEGKVVLVAQEEKYAE
jgi:hypothetical protein